LASFSDAGVTGNTHTSTLVDTLSTNVLARGWAVGMAITGSGFQASTTIAAIAANGLSLTLSLATTTTVSTTPLTVSATNALFAPSFVFSGLTAKVWTELLFGSAAGVGVFGTALAYLAGKGVELPFNQPLWQAAGFLSDPRANVDIGILTSATNSISNAIVGLRCTYLANVVG
jgi:hypothetical protein